MQPTVEIRMRLTTVIVARIAQGKTGPRVKRIEIGDVQIKRLGAAKADGKKAVSPCR